MTTAESASDELTPAVAAYAQAWEEQDNSRRLDLLASACSEDVAYSTPRVLDLPAAEVHGVRDLSDYIESVQKRYDRSVTPVGRGLAGLTAFHWVISSQDGSMLAEGVEAGPLTDDGRLQRISVEPAPSPSAPPPQPRAQPADSLDLKQFSNSVRGIIGE